MIHFDFSKWRNKFILLFMASVLFTVVFISSYLVSEFAKLRASNNTQTMQDQNRLTYWAKHHNYLNSINQRNYSLAEIYQLPYQNSNFTEREDLLVLLSKQPELKLASQEALALLYILNNRPNDAIKVLHRTLQNYPNYANAYQRLAKLLKSQGRAEEAFGQLQAAVLFAPNDISLLLELLHTSQQMSAPIWSDYYLNMLPVLLLDNQNYNVFYPYTVRHTLISAIGGNIIRTTQLEFY
ncbi:MAG: tetratricopeptide repeat protein [Victivallaceae bacterium]